MGVVLVKITYPKSAVRLLNRNCTIQKSSRYSDEILCICVAQGTAKLLEVKVGGLKNLLIDPIVLIANIEKFSLKPIVRFFQTSNFDIWYVVMLPIESQGCTVSHLKFLTNLEWNSI